MTSHISEYGQRAIDEAKAKAKAQRESGIQWTGGEHVTITVQLVVNPRYAPDLDASLKLARQYADRAFWVSYLDGHGENIFKVGEVKAEAG